jgi:hypothetical protein
LQQKLRSKLYRVKQPGLFQLKLNIGSTLQQSFNVPFPLKVSAADTRIAREESWIEFTAPVADMPFLAARPDNVFPLDMYVYESLFLFAQQNVH